jgi:hypothetical protein
VPTAALAQDNFLYFLKHLSRSNSNTIVRLFVEIILFRKIYPNGWKLLYTDHSPLKGQSLAQVIAFEKIHIHDHTSDCGCDVAGLHTSSREE